MQGQLLATGVKEKDIIENASMKEYTTLKIGGNAECLVKVRSVEVLKEVLKVVEKSNKKIFVIGNGSNLLVKDSGVSGIVLKIELDEISIEKQKEKVVVTVGSGVKLGKLGQMLAKDEITGLEELTGIPGTIGGAIRMNAGAHGREMKNVVTAVHCIDYSGNERKFSNDEMEFGYRTSLLKQKQYIVYKVEMELCKGDMQEIKAKLNQYADYRKTHQPIGIPNAGSTFKRGADFITAKLIDEAGLKGKSVGDISVSNVHAGFLVNNGSATAEDMIELISEIKKIVKEKFEKEIELEIEIMGD